MHEQQGWWIRDFSELVWILRVMQGDQVVVWSFCPAQVGLYRFPVWRQEVLLKAVR